MGRAEPFAGGLGPVRAHAFRHGLIAQSEPIEGAYRCGSDLAGVFYTDGTTGFPKGVMLLQAALAINALCVLAEGIVPAGAVGLHAAPMFHIADVVSVNAMFGRGATHVVIPSFSPAAVLQAVWHTDGEQTRAALSGTMVSG